MSLEGKRVLIIGGTGMLWVCADMMAKQGAHISVASRNVSHNRVDFEDKNSGGSISLWQFDYSKASDNNELISSLISYDIIVAWIHSIGLTFKQELINQLIELDKNIVFYDVLGSAYYNPAKTAIDFDYPFYRKVLLGYKKGTFGSRWLSNKEISQGCFEAISNSKKKHIIGQISPWEDRP